MKCLKNLKSFVHDKLIDWLVVAAIACATLYAGMSLQVPVIEQQQPVFIYPADLSVYAIVDRLQSSTCCIDAGNWSGSGVYIGDGKILTAKHVLEDSNGLNIYFRDGTSVYSDAYKVCENADVGVIYVGDVNQTAFKLSEFDYCVGSPIYMCGCPYGEQLAYTVTIGTVSNTGVTIDIFGELPLIIGDVSVWPGNSGGPVADENGQLIGILVGGNGAGLSMIIPVETIREFLAWTVYAN